jgi:hypothetical protein
MGGSTSNVTSMILLIASSSHSSNVMTGVSTTRGFGAGGGGSFRVTTRSGSLFNG